MNESFPVVTTSTLGQFWLASVREAGRVAVRASGRLVLGHGAEEAVWALHLGLDSGSRVTLDLSCVKDVDARGLGVLAGLAGDALERGVPMSVTAVSSVVQRVAEITRLDRVLPGDWSQRTNVPTCNEPREVLTRLCVAPLAGCWPEGVRSAAA